MASEGSVWREESIGYINLEIIIIIIEIFNNNNNN